MGGGDTSWKLYYAAEWRIWAAPATCLDGELSGSVTELSQRQLNERDYFQAHILVYPLSGVRLNRPRRIPSPNIHRIDPFNPIGAQPQKAPIELNH